MCMSDMSRDGYYDETGHWKRTKFCFVYCGTRCTCGPPSGYYNPLADQRKLENQDSQHVHRSQEKSE